MRIKLSDLPLAIRKTIKTRLRRQAQGTQNRQCPRAPNLSEATPHDMLWAAVKKKWPKAEREYRGGVPGRNFRIDIAFPEPKLAIEVEGYRHHGKYLADFKGDRMRSNLFTIHGWRGLRFAAGDIRKDIANCLSIIDMALSGLDHTTNGEDSCCKR